MGMFFHSSDASPERPADPAVRRANLRRIGALFTPYKRRLGGLLLLIVASAALGVVPAFLLRNVLEAIGQNDTKALSINAAGMIVIAIVTGVLGVIQTLLSNQVGQRVMHDLRAAHGRVGRPLGRRIGGVKEHAHHWSGYVAQRGQGMRQPGWRTTENLAETKSPFCPTSSRRSSIRRGSKGAPPPSVTGAIETMTSSSSPASAN